MAKRDQVPTMDPFSPTHQPDEGYSEDPLNPSIPSHLTSALSSLRSPADLPAWLAAHADILPVNLKSELTMALLEDLPTFAVADIVQRLHPRLYIDFVRYLPAEICLKILSYLDPVSLVSVARTCHAWNDLALDRKLWERLYHLEGWKVVQSEVDALEARVNSGIHKPISHIHRIQTEEGRTSKVRALSGEEDGDSEMTDSDRVLSATDAASAASIFGSPSSSFSSNRQGMTPMGDLDYEAFGKGKEIDRSFGATSSADTRGKRKEPGGDVVSSSLPPILPSQDPWSLNKATLWMWDVNQSRHRVNWKYLYNMRRRLESNWELGKYATFQLPHPSFPEEGHLECVYTIQFDADYLVSGSRDMSMRIWNLHTRRLARAPLVGHAGSVLCLQFDSDPEEDLVVSGSSDSNVFIWKFSTGELLQKITRAHRESVLNVRFDKRILVTSSKDKTIKIFNRRELRYGDLGYGDGDMVHMVGRTVAQPGYEPDLAMELPVKPPFTLIGRLDGHGAAVNAIQVRGNTIVSVSGDRHIKVWNWPEQVCVKTIPAHDKGIACVEYDGRRIVSGSSDYEVCIFDAPTGLKVAQLRGHAHLVRTVQAGFADLPYSEYEDEVEAKNVDAEFFRAMKSGEVTHPDQPRSSGRGLSANAGSSRPADIQALGAKLPPGGGGGRKYGRIVSGSYDQSIIVWRRDKEGVWKPAHHLRQEEAAATARLQVNSARRGTVSRTDTRHPNSLSHPGSSHFAPLPISMPTEAANERTPAQYMALIDNVVPLGVRALQEAILRHSYLLVYHDYLQAAIEREVIPLRRAQLRQVVSDALMSIQNSQSARRRLGSATAGPVTATNATTTESPVTTPQAASSSSVAGQAGSQAGSSMSSGGGSMGGLGHLTATPLPQESSPTPTQNHAAPQAPTLDIAQPQPPIQAHTPTGPPPPVAGVPAPAPNGNNQAAPQRLTHPHMPVEQGPARVFKLQFDAHKIVCCSQAPVIVGWDFCNGDTELEETSRFFAPID